MDKVVRFHAEGIIYKRTKDGQVTRKIQETRIGTGIMVNPGKDLYGKVFRHCEHLLRCDSISVKTYPI